MKVSRNLRLDLARYYRLPSVQVSLGVVLAFMISALFIMFAIRPTFVTIVELQKQISESRTLVTALQNKVSALNKAAALLDTIKSDLPMIEKSIPSDGMSYDELSQSLESLAQSSNVKLDNFTLGSSIVSSRLLNVYKPSRSAEVVDSPLTIRVSGSYASLLQFLNRLAGSIRLTSLENVTFFRDGARGSGGATTTELTLTVTGTVHYLAEPGALAKAFPEKEGGKK